MLRLPKFFNKTLSVRLSLMVVSAMALLLMASLTVMLHFSRKAVKEEALQKASQTLNATIQRIDNILLSVEQTAGNFYFTMLPHLDQPSMVHTYCRQLVESNAYVEGCAIAFKTGFYREGENFMAYYHREKGEIIQSEVFADTPYIEQSWFTEPLASGKPSWVNPLKGLKSDIDPIITFCLPIPDSNGVPTGVMGVDVSLSLLSDIVLATKPSANSYCILLDKNGGYIIHPDSTKLLHQTVFSFYEHEINPSVKQAAEAMTSGQTGYKPFHMNGVDYLVFFQPFKRTVVRGRSLEELGWSAGIIYPEDDIFGEYNNLIYYVFTIAIVGLLLMFLLCRAYIHRRLKPLLMLTRSAQRIAKGHYDETIPESHQEDEIGRLQDNFQLMQQSLAINIGELEQLTATMHEHGEGLRAALIQAQKADRMKTAFLHNMTDQMTGPAVAIEETVTKMCDNNQGLLTQDMNMMANDIQQNGDAIAEVLKNLINISDEKGGEL